MDPVDASNRGLVVVLSGLCRLGSLAKVWWCFGEVMGGLYTTLTLSTNEKM